MCASTLNQQVDEIDDWSLFKPVDTIVFFIHLGKLNLPMVV
jgi:hypothetical protein